MLKEETLPLEPALSANFVARFSLLLEVDFSVCDFKRLRSSGQTDVLPDGWRRAAGWLGERETLAMIIHTYGVLSFEMPYLL